MADKQQPTGASATRKTAPHAIPDAENDPRAVWQIAAEEGTVTAAVRELMLDEGITESQARKRVRDHRRATGTTGILEREDA